MFPFINYKSYKKENMSSIAGVGTWKLLIYIYIYVFFTLAKGLIWCYRYICLITKAKNIEINKYMA